MVKGLDKETIYFNFRLDIGITKFNDMDEFASVTKHMKGRKSNIPIGQRNNSSPFVKGTVM